MIGQLQNAIYSLNTAQASLEKHFSHASSDLTFLQDQSKVQDILIALTKTGATLEAAHAALKQAGVPVNASLEGPSTSQVLERVREEYKTAIKRLPENTPDKARSLVRRNLAAVNYTLINSYHADLKGISSQLKTETDGNMVRILKGRETATATKFLKLYSSQIVLAGKLKVKKEVINELTEARTNLKRAYPEAAATKAAGSRRRS